MKSPKTTHWQTAYVCRNCGHIDDLPFISCSACGESVGYDRGAFRVHFYSALHRLLCWLFKYPIPPRSSVELKVKQ